MLGQIDVLVAALTNVQTSRYLLRDVRAGDLCQSAWIFFCPNMGALDRMMTESSVPQFHSAPP